VEAKSRRKVSLGGSEVTSLEVLSGRQEPARSVRPPRKGRPRRPVPYLNRSSSRGPLCSLVGDPPRSRRPMTAVTPWSGARHGVALNRVALYRSCPGPDRRRMGS